MAENKIKNPILYLGLVIIALALVVAFFSFWQSLIILVGLGLILLSFKKIEYGVLFLAVYTVFEPFLLKFIPDEIYLFVRYGGEAFMVALLVIVLLQRLVAQKKEKVKTPIDLPLVLFLIVAVISMILNTVGPWYTGLLGIRQVLRYAFLFYIVVYRKPTNEWIKKIIIVLLSIVAIQVAIGLIQAIFGGAADAFLLPGKRRGFPELTTPFLGVEQFWLAGQRVFATLGRYDRLGVFITFFLLIAAGLAYQLKKLQTKKFLVIFILLSLPTLVLTYSRMSWLGFLLGLIFIGLLVKRDKRLFVSLAVVTVVITSYLGIYMAATGLKVHRITDQPGMAVAERILELFSTSGLRWGYRGYGRPYFIVHTVTDVVAANPFFGVGPGQYGGGVALSLNLTDKYDELGLPFGINGEGGQIDNNWFSIWGETGTLGFVAYAAIILSLFFYSLKVYRKSKNLFTQGLALGYVGALVAVTFQSFLGPYFEVRTLSMYLWLVGGLVVVLGQREGIQYKIKKK